MGVIGRAFQVFGALILLAAGLSAYLYLTDYGVEATVTEKGQDEESRYIELTTRLGGLSLRHDVPPEQWTTIQAGNFVVYHINTQRVLVYTSENGSLIYDSDAKLV